MAFVFIDGFDLYNGTGAAGGIASANAWQDVSSGGSISLQAGRFGGQCVRLVDGGGATAALRKTFVTTGTQSTFCTGFAFRHSNPAVNNGVLWWLLDTGVTVQLTLYMTADGSLRLFRGSGTTLLGTTPINLLTPSTWIYIEIFGTLHQTTGTVEVWINGVQRITFTGDTAATATVTWNGIQIAAPDGTGATNSDFDDMYFADTATRIGERRIETLRPSADTAQKQFTASTGTDNYAMVDETTVNTADYVYSSTVGHVDHYEFTDLSSNAATIDVAQITSFISKDDAGARTASMQVKSGSTVSDGTPTTMSSTASKHERILPTDPNTTAAWTYNAINALRAGPKVDS